MTDLNEATPDQLRARLAQLEYGKKLNAELSRAYAALDAQLEERVVHLRGISKDHHGKDKDHMVHCHIRDDEYPELYDALRTAIHYVLANYEAPA